VGTADCVLDANRSSRSHHRAGHAASTENPLTATAKISASSSIRYSIHILRSDVPSPSRNAPHIARHAVVPAGDRDIHQLQASDGYGRNSCWDINTAHKNTIGVTRAPARLGNPQRNRLNSTFRGRVGHAMRVLSAPCDACPIRPISRDSRSCSSHATATVGPHGDSCLTSSSTR
jgi:hypothetical protein